MTASQIDAEIKDAEKAGQKPVPTTVAADEQKAEAPPAPEMPNAVVVTRTFLPDGGFDVQVSHLGDVKVTEVVTILERAAVKIKRALTE